MLQPGLPADKRTSELREYSVSRAVQLNIVENIRPCSYLREELADAVCFSGERELAEEVYCPVVSQSSQKARFGNILNNIRIGISLSFYNKVIRVCDAEAETLKQSCEELSSSGSMS